MREVTFKELVYEVRPDEIVNLTVVDDMGGHEGTTIASLGGGEWWRSFKPGESLRAVLGPGNSLNGPALAALGVALLGCAGLAPRRKAEGGEPRAPRAAPRFTHARCTTSMPAGAPACAAEFTRTVGDGDVFDVVIVDTDTLAFTYVISGVVVPVSQDLKLQNTPALAPPRDTKTLWQVHDRKFGGYVVEIRRRDAERGRKSTLGDATIRVNVRTAEMRLSFGGGFTVSGLVDPVYGARLDTLPAAAPANGQPAPAPATQSTLVEDDGPRDRETRGVATFVHTWHTAVPWAALSFGLGLDQGRGANYYLGPSIRLGDKAFLTGGAAWGSVRTLPAGVAVGRGVNPTVLTSLPNRTARSWVVALSYGFIGGAQDALAKPFAGAPPQPTPPNSGAPGGGTAAASTGAAAAPAPVPAPTGGPLTGATVAVEGDQQSAAVGQALPNALAVIVTKDGTGVQGVPVTWAPDPSAVAAVRLSDAQATTDAQGRATAKVTVLKKDTHTVVATFTGLTGVEPQKFTVTGTAP